MLESCPFCGWHTPELKDVGMQRYRVQCPGCGGAGGICKNISPAERQWNTRADLPNKHLELYVHGPISTTVGDVRDPNTWKTKEHHPTQNPLECEKWCGLPEGHTGNCTATFSRDITTKTPNT